MKKTTPVLAACFGLAVALVSSAGTSRPPGFAAQDKEELGRIEQAIRAAIGWAGNKDLALLYRTIANDADFLEVHPEGDVVRGFAEFKQAERIWMSPDFKAVRFEIRDLRIKRSGGGDVAWFFCILDDINEWKGRPASWENTRWTGVLEKRDGRWVMVQQHFSSGPDAGSSPPSGAAYPVLFYSGRNDNKDVYILPPGEKEPRNLTGHPAQDLCPAASPDGKRVLFLSDRDGNMDIFSMAPDGSDVRNLTCSPDTEEHPEFTPDGKRILFVRDFERRTEIWAMGADGSEARRLTHNEARDERPFMSPDGSKIIFMSNRDGNYDIYTMAPDGNGQTRLTNTPQLEIFPVWSPDGTKIAYARKFRADGRMQGMVRVMNADGSGDRSVTAVETRDENPMWSPDGRHIILQSVRDGNFEVYQVDLDGSRPVRLTDHPAWDGWACYLPAPERELELTYVANMGVLIDSGATKVLIDALFDKPNPDYRAPEPETLDKIMKGEAPFDGVDLVLVSHDHPDHFSAGLAVRYLEAFPEAALLAPADAVEAMRGAAPNWARIGPRVTAVGLEVGEKRSLNIKGVAVTACRTLHSGDRDVPMNLMYDLEIDGRRVWHEGDPNGRCDVFQAFGLKGARLDLAIVHYWYPLEPNCARFLQEDLKAGHIALGHLPIRLEGDAPGKIDLVRRYYGDIFLLLPGMPARTFGK